MEKSRYANAQICLNGHVINAYADLSPERNANFCDTCGSTTITLCPNCAIPIRGKYLSMYVTGGGYIPPNFCFNCGNPFPWTISKLEAAHVLSFEIEGLDDEEKTVLANSINELVKDTPQTTIAITRFKKLMGKISVESRNALREIIIDIVSETARKALWPS